MPGADTLTHIARPLLVFRPLDPPQPPGNWSAGAYVDWMRIFGVWLFASIICRWRQMRWRAMLRRVKGQGRLSSA